MYTVFIGGHMRKIFFGFLFVMVRLLIGGFDIFPDPIGYGLIYLGASELIDRAPQFRQLKNIAVVGALFTLAVLGFDVLAFSRGAGPAAILVVSILSSAAGLVIIYVCGSKLMEAFGALPLNEEGTTALDTMKRNWTNYFTAMAISTGVVMYILMNPNPSAFMIVLVAGILSLVFAVMFLVRLHRFTRDEVNGLFTPPPAPPQYESYYED